MTDPDMPILVVDDYATMVKIMRNLLKQIGYANVDTAACGADALQLTQARAYGLIISDWNMSPMSGFDLLREIRATGPNQRTPFLMVTAESKTENVIAARRAGVSGYIVKPFNAAILSSRIDQVMADEAA